VSIIILIPELFWLHLVFTDFKKRRIVENSKLIQEHEPSGLDALASLAVLGENLLGPADSSAGATTKHPRHRPGCSCIVCIQPPSGKGRHKPTCTCNVCTTVKRRFKTLMLRKKKRQSEREADAAAKKEHIHNRVDESDTNGGASRETVNPLENEGLNRGQVEVGESSAGKIDLNCHPNRDDSQVDNIAKLSDHIWEHINMNQNGGPRTVNTEMQEVQHSSLATQSNGEDTRYLSDERCIASTVGNKEKRDEVLNHSNESEKNLS